MTIRIIKIGKDYKNMYRSHTYETFFAHQPFAWVFGIVSLHGHAGNCKNAGTQKETGSMPLGHGINAGGS